MVYRGLVFELTHYECGVDSQHTEGVVEDNFDGVNLARLVNHEIWKCAFGVEFVDVNRRVDDVVLKRRKITGELEGSRGAHRVANETFRVVDVGGRAVAKDFSDRLDFLNVTHRCRRRMGVDDIDVLGLHACVGEGGTHALGLALGVREHVVAGIGIDAVAYDFSNDRRAACLSVFKTLQSIDCTAFRDDNAVTGLVKGAAGFADVFVRAQGSLALEACKNAERLDTFTDTTCECEVDFAKAQHLDRLDQSGVARGAGGSDCIVRARDPHINGDFTCGIVGKPCAGCGDASSSGCRSRTWKCCRPRFRLDVAVFRRADVDANAALIEILEVNPAAINGFVGAVDRDTARSCSDTELFALLVFLRVEVADAGRKLPHIAHINELHASDALEEILAIFLECVAVGRGEANACDDDTRLLHK